jgi:uncharacterized protein YutE (UPF0331/DUF86 family)
VVADPEIIRDRESRIREYTSDLRSFAHISETDFLENRERQYAVLHALQLAIEACVEIATHICAADALGTPASYAEAFELLGRAGVLDERLTDDLRRMARFRNRIVHFYGRIDLSLVYDLLQRRLSDFDRYLVAVESYLHR